MEGAQENAALRRLTKREGCRPKPALDNVDEFSRVHGDAKNELTQIDREQHEEIERHRKEKEREERTLK